MPIDRATPTRRAILMLLAGATACGAQRDAPERDGRPVVSEGFATTDDSVRLWYRVVGEGPETVLAPNALYHGTRLDGLAAGRRIVLFDTRGRGRSDTVPSHKVSLRHNLLDVETIRRTVGAERVALIGWSGMGMELLVYALRHPDRVTRLIQLAPVAARWVPYAQAMGDDRQRRADTAAARRVGEREQAGEFAGDEAALCRARAPLSALPTLGDTSVLDELPDVCGNATEWPSRIGAFFAAFLPSIDGYDWRDSLALVTIPRLVIHGALDNTPLQGNEEWVASQPNARILVIEGAGHWPHYERPAATLGAMEDFLRGNWPAGARAIPATSR